MKKGDIAYYLENGTVRHGVLSQVNEPSKEDKKMGAQTLYEFGHGYATVEVFKTDKAAEKAQSERS